MVTWADSRSAETQLLEPAHAVTGNAVDEAAIRAHD